MEEKSKSQDKLCKMGNAFLNAQQMRAKLAMFSTIPLPLHITTQEFQFINTNKKENRTLILKRRHQLQTLDNSYNILYYHL